MRKTAPRVILSVISFVLAAVCAEVIVRSVKPQQLVLLRSDVWQPRPGLGWSMASNLDTRINTGEREIHLVTDEKGHRVGPYERSAIGWRILALGDSFVAAIQVEYDDLMTTVLERELEGYFGREGRVVNTGVGGWGPNHYLIKVREEVNGDQYDLVLVFLFAGNDIESERRGSFEPRTASKRHPLRFPTRLTKKEFIDAWAYPFNDYLERRSHLFVLSKNATWFVLMKAGLSARRFPVTLVRSEAFSSSWQTTVEICRDIATVAGKGGARTIFVLLPGAYQVDETLGKRYASASGYDSAEVDLAQPSKILVPAFDAAGLVIVDPLESLRQALRAGVENLYGTVDTHLGPAGHEIVAEVVFSKIQEVLATDV